MIHLLYPHNVANVCLVGSAIEVDCTEAEALAYAQSLMDDTYPVKLAGHPGADVATVDIYSAAGRRSSSIRKGTKKVYRHVNTVRRHPKEMMLDEHGNRSIFDDVDEYPAARPVLPPMNTVAITGNTYPHRRALGGKWDKSRSAWVLPVEKEAEALALLSSAPVASTKEEAALRATRDIARAAFPEWRGRKLLVKNVKSVTLSGTYWSGGSKNTFVAVELATGRTSPAAASLGDPNVFGGTGDNCPTIEIPAGFAIVEHVIFRGKDLGCRVYLPLEVEVLTRAEASIAIGTSVHQEVEELMSGERSR